MAVVAIIACISMTACSSENDVPASNDELEMYTVQLGWGGELEVTYEPLSRANTEDVYGIQVYSTPNKGDEQDYEWTAYAYGLFDDAENISIKLVKGYKYKFVATMIKDAKNVLTNTNNYFDKPFNIGIHQGGGGFFQENLLLDNSFTYGTTTFWNELQSGESCLKESSNGQNSFEHPNTDRFYGEYLNYIPSKDEKVSIPMKRVSFGASFVVINSIAKTGKLDIQLTDAPKLEIDFTAGELDQFWAKDIFTFSNVKDAYDIEDYSENIAVTINWMRDDGAIIPLGTHSITYKRNKNNIVTIKINNAALSNNIGFSIDNNESLDLDSMEEDDNVTIEDGEIFDTNVTPSI